MVSNHSSELQNHFMKRLYKGEGFGYNFWIYELEELTEARAGLFFFSIIDARGIWNQRTSVLLN